MKILSGIVNFKLTIKGGSSMSGLQVGAIIVGAAVCIIAVGYNIWNEYVRK
ncbi:hypothetical protein lbkm_0061 [Lachnospiraceae bacterium KM106-2]|nr:hypothetical protein lbkm_0061 [Lachnospiraceae bacterium KM106-2]